MGGFHLELEHGLQQNWIDGIFMTIFSFSVSHVCFVTTNLLAINWPLIKTRTQLTSTFSKSTIETVEKLVKYV